MVRRFESTFRTLGINKEIAQVTIANLISISVGAIFWVIIANLISPIEYGNYNYYVAIAAVGSTIAIVGLENTVTTFVPKRVDKIVGESNTIVFLLGITIGLLIFLILNNLYITFLLISIVSFSMSSAFLLGKKFFKEYAIIMIGQRSIQIVLSVWLYYQFGINGIIAGYVISYFVFSYRFFNSLRNLEIKFDEIKLRWKFVVHSYSTNISSALTTSADKIIIAPLFGFIVLGYYQFAFQFLAFLSVLPVILFHYFLPIESSGADNIRLKKTAIISSVALAVSIVAVGPFVVNSLFPKFVDASFAVQIMGMGIIPMTFVALFQSYLLSREKSQQIFLSSGLYLGTLVILFLTVGKTFGLIGLSISLVTALSIQAFSLFLLKTCNN